MSARLFAIPGDRRLVSRLYLNAKWTRRLERYTERRALAASIRSDLEDIEADLEAEREALLGELAVACKRGAAAGELWGLGGARQ